ncbi:MAG: hypothetical protein ABSG95_07315, partial [Solirubrobacteraceae bacterium]
TPQGGAAGEVPKLIAFVSQKTGLSQAEVLGALKKNFPHVTALLQAIPLSAVTAELPALFAFLEKTLHVSQAQLLSALQASFPGLTQSITLRTGGTTCRVPLASRASTAPRSVPSPKSAHTSARI